MKLVNKITAITVTLLIGFAINAQAQLLPETGSLGIRANLAGQPSIEVPYMFNETLSIAPYLGFTIFSDSDDNTNDGSKTFSVGVMPRYYMSEMDMIAIYATGNLGISSSSNNNPNSNSVTNFTLGVGYGAEFFISKNFSFSTDANLNLRAGDSQTRIGTAARVSASIYF
ncbi:MAG: outer membrane beta-barrel protein [Balneolaceae bacterium]